MGVLLRTEEKLPESEVLSNRRYEFMLDDKSRVVEAMEYDSNGDLRFRHTLMYDANGNITEQNRYNPDGSLAASITHTYAASTEPTPNITGFLATLSTAFLPVSED